MNDLILLSRYFQPTLRETPAEAQIVSHRLMLRAGLVRQNAAGIYSWLPLGLRVLTRVEQIVREEQNRSGAHEILMPTLQPADLWRESGRYDDYGAEMLRIQDRHARDLVYGPTNEEMVTQIFRDNIQSYRQLPLILYHIQWKFRDEVRPRFGVMRGREFLMKDAYSFDRDEASARISYQKMFIAYLRSFSRMGLRPVPLAAEAGPIGGDLSHEFAILAETGESKVFCHSDLLTLDPSEEAASADIIEKWTGLYARSDELHDPSLFAQEVPRDKQIETRGIEVGHIFYFGDKYTASMGCRLTDSEGRIFHPHCGSYGIGVSRLVGGIVEASHDDSGIIWPWAVAPFHVGVINLKVGDTTCDALARALSENLANAELSVLYDDRDERAGTKFSDMDLIGLPWQAIIGPRDARDGMIEIKARKSGARQKVSLADASSLLTLPPTESA